jgi:ATP-dependent DNA helicase RecG
LSALLFLINFSKHWFALLFETCHNAVMEKIPPVTENILAIIAQGMGADLHWFPESVGISELAETLAAMANANGGQVLIGVAPRSAKLQGIADRDAAADKVFQAALLAAPVLVLPVPETYMVSGKQVVLVRVPQGLPHIYNVHGRYLAREGHTNTPIPARRLRELLVTRGVVQFESRQPPGTSLDDLDGDQIEAYLDQVDRSGDDWQQVLLQRGCLVETADGLLPTYAALLLFGKTPQRWLPNATILAAHFPGLSFSDEFLRQDISGTLPQQLRQAEQFLRDNLQTVVRMVGLTHQKVLEYPFEAVRELLVNAVAHRDYNLQGDNIHLHLFSGRLEVHSPGELPGPVNLQNLLMARFSRNAVIAQILSDLGFVERLGYGLNRVVSVLRKNSLRAPKFEETGGSFRVILYAEPFQAKPLPDMSHFQGLAVNPRQQLALDFLAHNPRISSSDYQEICPDVHAETLRRDFADLVKRGVLIKMGSKRATYYILKSTK